MTRSSLRPGVFNSGVKIRALIPRFSPAASAVFNGLSGAAADAGHAVGTVVAPNRAAISQLDVVQRAGLDTFAAGDAGIGGVEGLGLDQEAAEEAIDRAGFQVVGQAGGERRKGLPGGDALGALLQNGEGGGADGLGLLLARGAEHGDVVFRHDHRNRSAVNKALFLADGLVFLPGGANVAAAGHDKVGLPAAGEPAGFDKVAEDPGQLPAVGGSYKDPGLLRGQLQGDPLADEGKDVKTGVIQGVG